MSWSLPHPNRSLNSYPNPGLSLSFSSSLCRTFPFKICRILGRQNNSGNKNQTFSAFSGFFGRTDCISLFLLCLHLLSGSWSSILVFYLGLLSESFALVFCLARSFFWVFCLGLSSGSFVFVFGPCLLSVSFVWVVCLGLLSRSFVWDFCLGLLSGAFVLVFCLGLGLCFVLSFKQDLLCPAQSLQPYQTSRKKAHYEIC